ncbi:MAG TPA: hypothetical protein PK404_05810 [Fervidobacterium sp.]|nr:hypothetical protein [Fervidobacterium sp.]
MNGLVGGNCRLMFHIASGRLILATRLFYRMLVIAISIREVSISFFSI